MSSRLRSLAVNLTVALVSVMAAALIAEAALRLLDFSYVSFHRPDETLGLRLRALAEGEFKSEGHAHVRVNSAGFRDRERALAKPKGTVRIAVLGDSYIEGLQVELDKTFPAVLERQLNDCGAFGGAAVEVLNFGVSSYGTAQQLLTYRYHASKYSPDLVLAAVFVGNDIRNNSADLEPDKMRPYFRLHGDALVLDNSFATSEEFQRRTNTMRALLDRARVLRVVQAAYLVKDRLPMVGSANAPAAFEAGIDDAVFGEPTTRQWRDAWSVTERLFAQLNDDVRAAGTKLLVVPVSSGVQVHPDPEWRRRFQSSRKLGDIFYPERRIEAIAQRLRVESVVLGPQLQTIAERDKIHFHGFANTRMGSGHWNEAGHGAAAQIVATKLCSSYGKATPS